jgi:hypothetical protein
VSRTLAIALPRATAPQDVTLADYLARKRGEEP